MVVGNTSGRAGYWLAGVVMLAALMHMITTMAYRKGFARYAGSSREIRFVRGAFGAVPVVYVSLCARVTITVFASTALLATAGYVFNEVFLYWFPNLGFSFCLLGVLLLMNLLGTRVAAFLQIVFVVGALGGLVFLTMAGIFHWGEPSLPTQTGSTPLAYLTQIGVAGLLVFVGFDLAGFSGDDDGNPANAMTAAIVVVGLLFIGWGWVSIQYVALDKLADSSIPHLKTARALLGQPGRIWMGMIILTGASAAVNALLLAVSRMMADMAVEGLLPPFLAAGKNKTTMSVLLLGALVAVMLASGMAGEPILEMYIKAGMCFWLIHYAVILGAAIMMGRGPSAGAYRHSPKGSKVLFVVGLSAMAWALVGVLILSADRALLLEIVTTIFAIGVIFAVIWIPLSKKKGWLKGSDKKLDQEMT